MGSTNFITIAREVYVITNHKPLVSVFKKDVETNSVTMNTVNPAENSPIHGANLLQTRA